MSVLVLWLSIGGSGDAWWKPFSDPGAAGPVESGREALGSLRAPWYDDTKDSTARFLPEPPPKPSEPWFDFQSPGRAILGRALLYLLLAVLLAALIVFLVYNFPRWKKRPAATARIEEEGLEDVFDALPIKVRRASDFLAEAERCVRAGDYERAILYYYSHQLLALDRAGAIRLAAGKTNGQYLREVAAGAADLAGGMRVSARLFEESFFGGRSIDRRVFEAIWAERDAFDRRLEARA